MREDDNSRDPIVSTDEEGSMLRQLWYTGETPSDLTPNSQDSSLLYARFLNRRDEMTVYPSYRDAVDCGFCSTREEYYSILRDLCIAWTQDTIHKYCNSDEARLIKLVLLLKETDLLMSRISEQISTWRSMVGQINQSSDDGVTMLSDDITRMKKARTLIAQDIAVRTGALLPNCSAIIGPLVAARLLTQAGGLSHLAQMPASAIQILGAKKAFFPHCFSGSSPPKHGCIYEHKRIHAAPKKIRGRVSRTLAASLAIAARIDYYRGTLDLAFLQRAEIRIRKAGEKR